ncbi:MAG: hypothetical protein Ct9H300mP16_03130 [Pseudomonadota bacterium]|nr:MAG: hypothetical protein Ct9H300mP16_03130 [Pseudomonadota bacterium]
MVLSKMAVPEAVFTVNSTHSPRLEQSTLRRRSLHRFFPACFIIGYVIDEPLKIPLLILSLLLQFSIQY